MSHKPTLDLADLDVETIQAEPAPGATSLESLTGGHGMTELAASLAAPCPVFLCSCCCCC